MAVVVGGVGKGVVIVVKESISVCSRTGGGELVEAGWAWFFVWQRRKVRDSGEWGLQSPLLEVVLFRQLMCSDGMSGVSRKMGGAVQGL